MSTVESWNAAAARLVDSATSAAVSSAVLLVVVAVVWFAVRRRASAHLGHALFLVPLAPLVLPALATVELPAWIPSVHTAESHATTTAVDPEQGASRLTGLAVPLLDLGERGGTGPLEARTPVSASAAEPSWKAWLLLGWAVVAAGLALRLIAVQIRTHRMLRAAPELGGPEGDRVRARLERLAPRLGLHRSVRLVQTDAVPTPAVWGLRRPVIAFDRALAARLGPDQLDWVLLHELAHLARLDLVRGSVQRLVQVLWFFNPLVWLAGRIADGLREAACDETALAVSSLARRRECAEALVEVAAHGAPRARRALLHTLQEDKTQMKKRIVRLLDTARVPARRSSPTGLLLCGALLSSSLVDVTLAQDPPRVVESEVREEASSEPGPLADEDVQAAIERSLGWLLARQAEDGHWPTGPDTEAATGEFNSVGVTGLVLLALEQAQHREARPERARAVERGRAFLAAVQREDGLFGAEAGHRFMQSHAVATLAWLKTRAGAEDDAWRPAAERAVALILRARNPYMGWRFDLVPVGDCDTFTTSLMLAALREARAAGLEVPERAWLEPLGFIDRVTEPSNGRTGYDRKGGNDARLAIKGDDYPAELTQLSTAVALTTRMDWGQSPSSSEVIRRGAFLLSEFAPRWDEEAGSIDYYYWLFGTRALVRLGGAGYDHWREALVAALVPHQMRDRDGGWWPAIDAWATEGTRVHSTVVCTLALQAAL